MAQNIPTMPERVDGAQGCPIDHQALSRQKTGRTVEPVDLPLECDASGVWHVRGFEEARTVLRSGDTKQAGFNAEMIADVKSLENKPILYQEGKVHQQQRKQTARFFTPKTVSTQYRQFMETLSDQLAEKVKREKQVDLGQLSLSLAVQVAARVVGLTDSRLPGMDRRLDAFFHQSSNDSPLMHRQSRPCWESYARYSSSVTCWLSTFWMCGLLSRRVRRSRRKMSSRISWVSNIASQRS
ncbi:hypothetical protein KDW_51930 [Dictyobacter vulcani]|uniref:Cytochrome P450 n=1 Tax=Dictyobacter vulcani TaxID=2607529 RepID=A0A5J4KX38_9CHLR|nr:cytochrome P450 [Dictyobacter vulcani]GER91031.1 hypothetical protein KDW_51930 [Dictyobacter vulcani]